MTYPALGGGGGGGRPQNPPLLLLLSSRGAGSAAAGFGIRIAVVVVLLPLLLPSLHCWHAHGRHLLSDLVLGHLYAQYALFQFLLGHAVLGHAVDPPPAADTCALQEICAAGDGTCPTLHPHLPHQMLQDNGNSSLAGLGGGEERYGRPTQAWWGSFAVA
jgi:hypothetical protein